MSFEVSFDGLEARASRYIGNMPFLWLAWKTSPAQQACAHRSSATRSRFSAAIASRRRIHHRPTGSGVSATGSARRSGLWNNNHVDEDYDSSFLDLLERRMTLFGSA